MEDAEGMTAQVRAMMARERRGDYLKMERGANWFVWIGGMTAINSAVALTGSSWHFVIGLGLTQLTDGVAQLTAEQLPGLLALLPRALGLTTDLALIGAFIYMGVQGRKGRMWPFVVGMAAYVLDAILTAAFSDWLGVGFHIFALVWIYSGLEGLRHLRAAPRLSD